MKQGLVQLNVPLSQLVPSRRNPRKVKPGREAHQRLVASIGSQGLLQPLVVRPLDGKPKRFEVVAGDRRLKALREIHREDGDPKIPCVLREVDAVTADALSLGENFARDAMHPLDEAEAFAKLAAGDGKDAAAIAAEFGVPEHYVRQRMKLATLAELIKAAFRDGSINTAMAEAFAAVPEDRQLEVWQEVNGHPRHAEHVRNVIANAWIDATHALFDLSTLPESAVSRDLFGDRLLIERKAFMEAQAKALELQHQALGEDGWKEVVIGRREEVQDRLYAMEKPEPEFDEATTKKLIKLSDRRQKLEMSVEKIDDGDQARFDRLHQRYEALQAEEQEIVSNAPEHFSEETKAVGTAFVILDPDGRVHREYRIPRQRNRHGTANAGGAASEGASGKAKVPTSDELSDRQLAVTFTHQALAVREAVLQSTSARRRILAMILHDKVRSDALAVRHEANGITLNASKEGFSSEAFKRVQEKRAKFDPFHDQNLVEDRQGYEQLKTLTESKLNALIDLLVVECITANLQHQTDLVRHLAQELKVNVREHWKPDVAWLSSFQKIQLAHLITELKGPVHARAPEKKKSELVDLLAKLFVDAADGTLEDKPLAERVNRWVPANLRQVEEEATGQERPNKSK